ncbi:MAG: MBL fold metallo-hydrolase [Chloroflexales bacterium]|nr:MBL fold metallo-hydrolase [Chloroflexales bacterium]
MPDITYLGHSCFRLRGRDGVVLCDPFDRSVGVDIGRPTAHIVTVSHDHPDHNNTAAVRPLRESTFVINGPGEYEVSGVLITGVRTAHDAQGGKERGFNTAYVIHLDDVAFCHLGDLGHELTQSQIETIGSVDVLFVPVGGGETIGADMAPAVISQLEPRIVIPMHYATDQLALDAQLEPLDKFTHALGLKEVKQVDKLTVSATSLPAEGEQAQVVVMQPTV